VTRIAILALSAKLSEDYFFLPLAAGFFAAGFFAAFFFSATEVHLRSGLMLMKLCLRHRFVTRKFPAD
jgi:hypothetical protein